MLLIAINYLIEDIKKTRYLSVSSTVRDLLDHVKFGINPINIMGQHVNCEISWVADTRSNNGLPIGSIKISFANAGILPIINPV